MSTFSQIRLRLVRENLVANDMETHNSRRNRIMLGQGNGSRRRPKNHGILYSENNYHQARAMETGT